MDFNLTSEQESLRTTVRDLIATHYPSISERNAAAESPEGYSPALWQALAELGAMALPFSEDNGGVGATAVEVSVVAGELGRVVAPEPLADAVYVPGFVIERAGTAEQAARVLPDVAEGTSKLALAHEEPGSRWPFIQVDTTAAAAGSCYTLTGYKALVAAGDIADVFVVSARLADGALGLFLVDGSAAGLTRHAYRTHDLRRGADLQLDGVAAERLDGDADTHAVLADTYVYAQTIQASEMVEALRTAVRITADYLTQRKQFGVTLSTFEALTHRAADMFAAIEPAASLAVASTAAIADGTYDATLASQMKLLVGRAATFVGEQAVQTHGGIGITFEYPISHYLSRAVAVNHSLGSTEDHLRVLADQVRAG